MSLVARHAGGSDLGAVLDLIVGQQARRDRNVPSVGTDHAAVRAELEDLEPPWTDTLRVLGEPGRVFGAVAIDWSVDAGRAWVYGPWIDVDDDRWVDLAEGLVAAATDQTPAAVTSSVLSADVAHRLMAALADRLGWPGELNHVLFATAATIGSWPVESEMPTVRAAAASDLDGIRPLHDVEFPATYFSASEVIARAGRGEQVVLVAEYDGGGVCGYVAGRIDPDGDGYVDFLAVAPGLRRAGVGGALVRAVSRALVPASSTQRVSLTVQDSRHGARAFYESLGFVVETSIVGYREPITGA